MTTLRLQQGKSFSRIGALIGATLLIAGLFLAVGYRDAQALSTSYTTAGSINNYTVPAGITEISFVLQAGSGQTANGNCGGVGGRGANVSGTLGVTPGDVLTFIVGADGEDSQYGGSGGLDGGGDGGDATYLYLNGEDRNDIVATAGAGGGGGASPGIGGECDNGVYGGNGGDASVSGFSGAGGSVGANGEGDLPGGSGATVSAVGAGADIGWEAQMDGEDGFGFEGGNGGDYYSGANAETVGGGGGGEGYYGGGGGAGGDYAGAGGGAGSSFYDAELVDSGIAQTSVDGAPFASFTHEDSGEGSTTTTTTTTSPSEVDTDLDGVADSIENGAPNGGDGNGDGTADRSQSNVSSLPTANGQYATVVSPSGTQLTNVNVKAESAQATQDGGYQFKFGLASFVVTGVTPGATIEMNLYFATSDAANSFIARKLVGTTYSTLEGASITNVLVGASSPAVKLTYGIADGGPLDNDGVANGSISDPVGLASANGTLAVTGNNASKQITWSIMLILSGALVFGVSQFRRRKALI